MKKKPISLLLFVTFGCLVYILIIDFYIHNYLIQNISDTKDVLRFRVWNYPFVSILLFGSYLLSRKKKDTEHLQSCFQTYIPSYKQLMTSTSFEKLLEQLPNYMNSICCLHYSKHIPKLYVYSMLSKDGLSNIEDCVNCVLNDKVRGDFVEAGIWRGGTGILMKSILNEYKCRDRKVFLLDSFEGMENIADTGSSITQNNHPIDVLCSHALNDIEKYFGQTLIETSVDEVEHNLKHFGCWDDNVVLVKGWFTDDYPFDQIREISVLRLDCDYYYPTMVCLEHLYDKISVGGFIILDEYYLEFMGERLAVDDFRHRRGITTPVVRVDKGIGYWRKEET